MCSTASLVQRGLALLLQSWCSHDKDEVCFCKEGSNMLSQQIYPQVIRLTNHCSDSVSVCCETILWMRMQLQTVLAALEQHFHLFHQQATASMVGIRLFSFSYMCPTLSLAFTGLEINLFSSSFCLQCAATCTLSLLSLLTPYVTAHASSYDFK